MSKNPLMLALMTATLAACSAAAGSQAELETTSLDPAPVVAPGPDLAPPPAQAHAEPARETARHVSHDMAITCDVRARRTSDDTLIIQARAFADRDIDDGEYDLAITKSGGGNSSEISQSGALTLRAGHAATLGENEISLERGARVRATLTLYDGDRQICREIFDL
jgi:hypothetical protein